MKHSVFTPAFADLPEVIPVFPLDGAILMPGTQLPLNIFEPRYLSMVRDALAADQFIGMIQNDSAGPLGLAGTGVAGRIVAFSETPDGRYLIALDGISRFDVQAEETAERGYRRVRVSWRRFEADCRETATGAIDEGGLRNALTDLAEKRGLEVDAKTVEQYSGETLVNVLVSNLPLSKQDVQKLIETPDAALRGRLLLTTMQRMVSVSATGSGVTRVH
ncbi:MAG: LON peptidase substrate-binding domain-containing protein [Gammaproteobacteria bacterium]